jgi:hypothetical protein
VELNQINLLLAATFYLSQIYFNIVHPPTSWSAKWSMPFQLSHQKPCLHSSSPHACCILCPSHPPWLYHSNLTWWRVQLTKLLIIQFSPTFRHFIPLRSKYSPQHLLLKKKKKKPCLCSPLNVRDQVSHQYVTTDKIIGLYVLIFRFVLDSRREDKRFWTE